MRVRGPSATAFSAVASVTVTVSGAGMADLTTPLTETGTTPLWTGTALHIPSGSARNFHARAYDGANHLLYEGSTTSDLAQGQTITIDILAEAVAPPPPLVDHAPVIEAIVASQNPLQLEQVEALAATVVHPDGRPMTFAWTATNGANPSGHFGSALATQTSWAPDTLGDSLFTFTATDDLQVASSVSFPITVVPSQGTVGVNVTLNDPPFFNSFNVDTTRIQRVGDPVKLTAVATDPNGDAITFAFGSDTPGCTFTFTPISSDGTTATTTFTVATLPPGNTCRLLATATDIYQAAGSAFLTINVGPPPTAHAFKNCAGILSISTTAQSGLYAIDSNGGPIASVYCDMKTDGGGWTLVGNLTGDLNSGGDPGYIAWGTIAGYQPALSGSLTQTWRSSDSDLNGLRNGGVYRLTGNGAFGTRFAKSTCTWLSTGINQDCDSTYADLAWNGQQTEGPANAGGGGGKNGVCYDFGGINDYLQPNCNLWNPNSYVLMFQTHVGTNGQGFTVLAPDTSYQIWVR